jgi:hypothetical protein
MSSLGNSDTPTHHPNKAIMSWFVFQPDFQTYQIIDVLPATTTPTRSSPSDTRLIPTANPVIRT